MRRGRRLPCRGSFGLLIGPDPGRINSVARLVPRMLLDMQNRGQLAAGMTSYRPDRNALIKTHKEVGTVAEAFRLNHREEFETIMRGVDGRPRSATCAMPPAAATTAAMPSLSSATMAARPSGLPSPSTGSSPIIEELKDELLAKGDYHLKRDTDTEIIMHSLAYELQAEDQEPDWVGVFGRIAERFDGAYNIVLITAHGELVVVRDPLGFRPLCIAEHGPLVRRRQRERAAGQPGLSQHPIARARHAGGGQLTKACGSSGSPPRPGRPIASSSGSISPTSPARSTIARSI